MFALATLIATAALIRPGMMASTCSDGPSRAAISMSDVPSIIVGGGRIGSALRDLGVAGDVLLRRGDPFPTQPESGPIYVTTRAGRGLEGGHPAVF